MLIGLSVTGPRSVSKLTKSYRKPLLCVHVHHKTLNDSNYRGTQREYSSKPLKHGIVKRFLVFKQ